MWHWNLNQVSMVVAHGLAPIWRQAITHADILSILLMGTDLSEIRIKMQNLELNKMHLKKYRQQNGAIFHRTQIVDIRFNCCK